MKNILRDVKNHLMTGVSYMIPFILAGGLLLTIGLLLEKGGSTDLTAAIIEVGLAGLGLMVPILSGYIAYSIGDRAAIAPGMIGGVLASDMGTGFLGGLASGFIAGYVVKELMKMPLPTSLMGLKTMILVPFLGTSIVACCVMVVGGPIAALSSGIESILISLQGGSLLVMGFVVAAMMAVDMGGPINKVCYTFCAAMVVEGIYEPMAACWIGVMAPPVGLAIASYIAPKKFYSEEKSGALSAAIMGLTGITEGAIPFAAIDPLRVIPSIVIGSGIGGALTLLFGCTSPVTTGGIFVVPFFENAIMFLLAFAIACACVAGFVILLKKDIDEEVEA